MTLGFHIQNYDTFLLVLQGLNESDNSVAFYKEILHQDNMNIEAIASIGTYYFYTDQPEIALKFYRYGDLQNLHISYKYILCKCPLELKLYV